MGREAAFKRTIQAEPGHAIWIREGGYEVKIVSHVQPAGAIRFDAEIFRTGKAHSAIAHPSVITRPGSPAELRETTEDGTPLFRLKLAPRAVAQAQ